MNIRSKLAILAAFATIVVTVVGMAIPIVKPAYAQLDDIISGEQIVVGEEEIPELDDIREKVEELTSSQSVPRLPEQATGLFNLRPPPAFAG